ncbi:helix-turn-helix domain-containing protein [Saccharopolyspora cebuensis]|uniref:Helix-turn-helix domain-containing protein n=1 Tax=Saccharopolyspora cebuensis TaxID=418759 RepID=A0ABV4CMJ1_9PSEU
MVTTFGGALRAAREAAGLSQPRLAALVPCSQSSLSRYESGRQAVDLHTASRLDDLLSTGGMLRELARGRERTPARQTDPGTGSEFEALELARRVAASDVGDETLTNLECAFDDLATDYPTTAPIDLLPRIDEHVGYVGRLLDTGRMSLGQHRRLVIIGGWLSLLAATVHIDLDQHRQATAWLRCAASLANDAEHPEIRAWIAETEAWRAITRGDHRRARELARTARHHAPTGSSIAIQATAQEGRAAARLGDADATYRALEVVHDLCARLGTPADVEHHYRYDPTKADAYTATTLAWLGDPEGERYAREVIARFAPHGSVQAWPRRYASAHVDLALIAAKTNRLDEACGAAHTAIATGQIPPSNYWRLSEVVTAVTPLPESSELREAYRGMIHGG